MFELRPEAVRVVCPADYPAVVRHLARCNHSDDRQDGANRAPRPTAPKPQVTA